MANIVHVRHARYPLSDTRVQKHAEALRDRGHQVFVVCTPSFDEPAREAIDDIEVLRVGPVRELARGLAAQAAEYAEFAFHAGRALLEIDRQARIDLVQVHAPPDLLAWCALPVRLSRRPLVLDVNDLLPEFLAERLGTDMDALPVRLALLEERMAMLAADHVMTVSEPWRQTLIGRGARERRSSVVMNVADVRHFRPRPAAPAEPASLDDEFRIVYHGTVVVRYGIDVLIRAMARVCRQVPGARLTINGWGRDLPELQRLAADHGLDGYVTFQTRMLRVAELADLIAAAHLAVVPNRGDLFTDGIVPTKLFEYMAIGLPVVASRTSGIEGHFAAAAELVAPGDEQALADAIVRLRLDPARRAELSAATAAVRGRYDWSVLAADYVRTIETLIDRRRRGAARAGAA